MKKITLAATLLTLLCACQNEQATQTQQSVPASAASNTSQTTAASAASVAVATSNTASAAKNVITGVDVRKDDLGGDFTLTDGDGKPFSLSSLKGKVVIMSFGFTHCPDVCPTELLAYSDALKQLGDQAKDVAVVFVSVDPERDTPELMKQYVQQFNPNFIGLTDTNGGRDIALAKQLYRIVSAKTEIKADNLYNVDHTSGAYLLDKNGNAAIFARYGMEGPEIADEVRKLLAE